jgi:hypothetical protein
MAFSEWAKTCLMGGQNKMKTIKLATLTMAVLLYTTAALAQHGHSGGAMGSGMANTGNGNGIGHETASTNHGSASITTTGSAHGKTMDDILNNNTHLADQISKLTGESATTACAGFKNLGQCVAAAHVAKNLGFSFACLKDDMTGTAPTDPKSCPAGTGTKGSQSLGKSIQSLDPNADQKSESKKGENQAAADLKESNS